MRFDEIMGESKPAADDESQDDQAALRVREGLDCVDFDIAQVHDRE